MSVLEFQIELAPGHPGRHLTTSLIVGWVHQIVYSSSRFRFVSQTGGARVTTPLQAASIHLDRLPKCTFRCTIPGA